MPGSIVVFKIVVDDYAEVRENGRLPFMLGQNGCTVAAGWNVSNRAVLTRDPKLGQKSQVAVLGITGLVATLPETCV